MKKVIRMAGLALALALGTATAQAQDFGFKPYIGAGAGAFNLDAGFGSGYTFGGFGFIGADINDYLAAEIRGGTTGSTTILFTDHTVDWFVSYLGKLKLPVNDQIGLYGLLGASTVKTKLSVLGLSVTNTSTSFTFGGGGEFAVDDQLHIGAEWVSYCQNANAASPTFPGMDVWSISGTLRYSF